MKMNTKKPISGFSRSTVLATIICIVLLAVGWYSYQHWFKDTRTADEKKLASYRLEIANTLSQVSANTPVGIDLVVRRQDGTKHGEWDEVRGDGEYMRLVVAYHDLSAFQVYYPKFDPATQTFSVELNFPQAGSVVLFADVVPDTGLFSDTPTVHPSIALIVSGPVVPSQPSDLERTVISGAYSVALEGSNSPLAGESTTFHWKFQKGDEVVEVDKKEGAYGRLSIIRQGSMEYSAAVFANDDLHLAHTFTTPGVYAFHLETQVGDDTVQVVHRVLVGSK